MIDAIRSIRAWQIGVLVAVLAGGIGATYGVYSIVSSSGQVVLDEAQQMVPVTLGDLVNDVSINGSLVFPNRETLTFGIQGTVGEVLVEEGQRVDAGDPLATLDVETVANLERTVAQAEVSLRDAEGALAGSKSPYTYLDMAQGEADVANSRLAYQAAQESLAALEPTAYDIAQAEAKVANARTALDAAEESVAALLETDSGAMAKAEAAVVNARIAVDDELEELEALRSGPTEEDVSRARSQVDSATTALTISHLDLKLSQDEWDDKLQAAQGSFDAAVEAYQTAMALWLGAELTDEELALEPAAVLESWGADLSSLFAADSRFYDLGQWYWTVGIPADDPATRWNEAVVYTWVNFYPGAIALTCGDEGAPFEGKCVESEINDAWEAYQGAVGALDTVETQAAKAIANSGLSITRAQDSLSDAEAALAELIEPAHPLKIEAAEKQLKLTAVNLQVAEDNLAALVNGPDESEVDVREKQVALARANLEEAQSELAGLVSGADPLEIDAGQKQLEVARARLIEAEEDLLELRAGVDPLEIALKEADVAAARAALEAAVQRLGDSTITARWSGIISAVDIEVGQAVNANTPTFEIVDPSVIEVEGTVDEIDVLFIRGGAAASVIMDALPGQVLEGTVTEIAAEATTQQGVVTYPMRIQVQAPEGLELPEGLSAVASVVIREDRNVLLVPLDALYGTFEQPVVRVMNGSQIEERQVVLGNTDDFWVVVEEGLAEAELVVMESRQAATTGTGFAAFRGLLGGGGFGGHGGGFARPGAGGGGGGQQR